MRWMHRGVNRMRRKYGLPPRPDHLSEFEADFNFLTETQMFAPQGRLPPNFVQMGPVFHQSFGAETDVLDKLAPEKHTIFLNLGGTGNPESLRALTDPYFARYNILSVGWGPGQVSASHIISREFLHLDTLLPRVDLVFTQGGVGNLFHSWSYGIPTICVPTFFEQEWNAARVVDLDLGAAFFSPPSREQVIDTVEKWIDAKNDARFKQLAASIDLQESKAIFRHHLLRFLKLEDTVVPN